MSLDHRRCFVWYLLVLKTISGSNGMLFAHFDSQVHAEAFETEYHDTYQSLGANLGSVLLKIHAYDVRDKSEWYYRRWIDLLLCVRVR